MSTPMLPAGTLAFLFTDLEGSTRLLHEIGPDYARVLEDHRALIRTAVTAHGGIEFGTGGDAIFVVFTSTPAAVAAAADAQRALSSHPWPTPQPPRVRMAVHTGEAEVVDDDYVGTALHLVARLCAAGHGGQVLVSPTARALAPRVETVSLGVHQLRDIPEPVEIHQLYGNGLERTFPALRTLTARPNNLPVAPDRLIGRELEVVEVAETLADARLVTLTGAGGSGKTRLSLEVGAALLGEFVGGVWSVPLAAATTPAQVPEAVAAALGVGGHGGESLAAALQDRLAREPILLVIDNCEHLVDAVATFVEGALHHAPTVKVLATSRERLGVRGEHAIAVAPLAVGSPDRPGAAMTLFLDRVRALGAGFEHAAGDSELVWEICRRLDGLPLAIELAAARLRSMSLAQLASRLDDRFRLLTTGLRSALPRQQTLEAVVAWSYELLDPDERATFERLALFAGDFDLQAAESVAGSPPVEPADVLDLLGRLVDKSLLVPARGDDVVRFRMLETLRQYGRQRLGQSGDLAGTAARYAAWARGWADQLHDDLRTARQDASQAAAARERDNLRAAYEQALADDDQELALRLVVYAPIMLLADRQRAVESLLGAIPDMDPELLGDALTSVAQFAFARGEGEGGVRAAREAAEVFAAIGARSRLAWARYFEVFALWVLGDVDATRVLANDMLDEFEALGDPLGTAYMTWVSSQLADDLDVATVLAERADEQFRKLAMPFGLGHSVEGHALIAVQRGQLDLAATLVDEALVLLSGPEDSGCTAHAIEAAAMVLAGCGRRVDAARLLGAADALRRTARQSHRPWELMSRRLAEEQLDDETLRVARRGGEHLSIEEAVADARRLLGEIGPARMRNEGQLPSS